MNPSLAPVAEPFAPDVAAILAGYPQRDGYVLQLFRVFANSVRFLKKGTVNLLDRDSPLPMRLRELVILRVTANNDCEYEWGVHVAAFAAHVGFSEEQVAATRLDDPRARCWNAQEQVLLRAVDELCGSGRIMPVTYREIRRHFSLEQQLEILALAGNYHTICFIANTADLPGEPFGARFPTPRHPMAADAGI